MSDKTCGTCDLAFSNHNYSNLLFCNEVCDFARKNDDVCECYQERTDSIEQVARDLYREYRNLMRAATLSDENREYTYATIEDAERRLKALGVEV